MPRKKVKLAYIKDNSARRTSLKKRKDSLKKKLDELSTLCGVDACAIIYIPGETYPELWPNREGVENVLEQLRNVPVLEQSKKMFDHDDYIKKKITKTEELLNKQVKENREKEVANKMSECLSGELSLANLNLTDLNDLVWLAGDKVSQIQSMIKFLKKGVVPAPPQPPPPPPPDSQPMQPQGGVCGGNTDNHMMAADGYYVPVAENHETFYGTQTSYEWLPPDWFDSMGEHFGSCSRGW